MHQCEWIEAEDRRQIVEEAVKLAVAAQMVVLAILGVIFLFVGAASDSIDVPGVRWPRSTQLGGD